MKKLKKIILINIVLFSCAALFAKPQNSVGHPKIKSIAASSTLVEKGRNPLEYAAGNLMDKTWKSWSEGQDGDGVGTRITVNFIEETYIDKIYIRNGFGNLKLFFDNNRVKKMAVEVKGKKITDFYLEDTWKVQSHKLGITADELTLIITEVYKGKKYNDTCLAELMFDPDDAYDGYDDRDPYSVLLNKERPGKFGLNMLWPDTAPLRFETTLQHKQENHADFVDCGCGGDEFWNNVSFLIFKNNEWTDAPNDPIFAEIKKYTDLYKDYPMIFSVYDYPKNEVWLHFENLQNSAAFLFKLQNGVFKECDIEDEK